MAEQTTISIDEFSNFLQSGALLSESENMFKLIWGPFEPVMMDLQAIPRGSIDQIFIYKPDFWDFLENKKDQTKFWTGRKEVSVSKFELLKLANQISDSENPITIEWQSENWDDFENQFNWSFQKFEQSNLMKSVPITKYSGQILFTPEFLNRSLKNVLKSEAYGSVYGFWQDGVGFLGLTPEIIGQWNLKKKEFSTMALAGTLKNSSNVETEMLKNLKLMKEHQIVVEDIKQSILKINSEVNISSPSILKLPFFSHLRSDLTTIANNVVEALTIAESIHPSAALGLFPKQKSLAKKFSQFDLQKIRMNFAAPFGFIKNEELNIIAAIRNFFFSDSRVTIFSGCGVIPESILETEIEELRQKRKSVQKMMGFNL